MSLMLPAGGRDIDRGTTPIPGTAGHTVAPARMPYYDDDHRHT
jgi:hypothetical protein